LAKDTKFLYKFIIIQFIPQHDLIQRFRRNLHPQIPVCFCKLLQRQVSALAPEKQGNLAIRTRLALTYNGRQHRNSNTLLRTPARKKPSIEADVKKSLSFVLCSY